MRQIISAVGGYEGMGACLTKKRWPAGRQTLRSPSRISFVVALLLALSACSSPASRSSPTVPPTAPATISPTAVATAAPATPTVLPRAEKPMVVANTDGEGVNLRADPGTASRALRAWPEGTEMEVIGPDRQAGGATWKNVRDPEGNAGWVMGDYLVPKSAYTPSARPSPTRPAPTVAPAPTKPVAATPTAPPSGRLEVQAVLGATTVAGGTQNLTVTVLRDGSPVRGAKVAIVVQYPTTMRTYSAPDTGPDGKSVYSWPVVDTKGRATVIVEVTAGEMRGTTRADFTIE